MKERKRDEKRGRERRKEWRKVGVREGRKEKHIELLQILCENIISVSVAR